jgi:hypothetical protein
VSSHEELRALLAKAPNAGESATATHYLIDCNRHDIACGNFIRKHGADLLAERDALAEKVKGLEALLAEAPVVEFYEDWQGDNKFMSCDGASYAELVKMGRVRLVRAAAIAHAPGAGG